jgi:hypothetical protein
MSAFELNAKARQLAAAMDAAPESIPHQLAGERMAIEFVAGLNDGNAGPDELMLAVGLLGRDPDEPVRWFLRALQVRLAEGAQ